MTKCKNCGHEISITTYHGSWYHSKFYEVTRMFLNEKEIEVLFAKDFKNERLSLVRDIFLFSCFTGLAYIDTQKLTYQNINLGLDGSQWIYTKRQKTKTTSNIPLLLKQRKLLKNTKIIKYVLILENYCLFLIIKKWMHILKKLQMHVGLIKILVSYSSSHICHDRYPK